MSVTLGTPRSTCKEARSHLLDDLSSRSGVSSSSQARMTCEDVPELLDRQRGKKNWRGSRMLRRVAPRPGRGRCLAEGPPSRHVTMGLMEAPVMFTYVGPAAFAGLLSQGLEEEGLSVAYEAPIENR